MAWVFQNELRLKLSDDIHSQYLLVCFKVFRKIQILHVSSKTEGRPRRKWCSEVKRPWIGQVQVGVVKFCYWTTLSKSRLILWLCRLIQIAVPLPDFLLRRLGGSFCDISSEADGVILSVEVNPSDVHLLAVWPQGGVTPRGPAHAQGASSAQKYLTGLHGKWSVTRTLLSFLQTQWCCPWCLLYFLIYCTLLSCKPKVVNFSFCLNVSVGKCRIYAFGNEVFFWIDYYQPGCLQTGAIEQNVSVCFFSHIIYPNWIPKIRSTCELLFTFHSVLYVIPVKGFLISLPSDIVIFL